ncbi:MAG: prepilin-type N-terminal cleavage/methylation domain-containing protein [Clostridia bacterium]|nr:prepilin-type N-terminal cleavage/methylation domain-containing protein [Clostridia bacterium]
MLKKVNNKGFTLVELLISLGLLGLIISAASFMYFTGVQGFNRSENQVKVQQNLRIAMNTLSSEIRKADGITIHPDERKIDLFFHDGSAKSYEFDWSQKEIRLSDSNSTVAMYIDDCRFGYDSGTNLIKITLVNQVFPGVQSREYTFSINARGKVVNK